MPVMRQTQWRLPDAAIIPVMWQTRWRLLFSYHSYDFACYQDCGCAYDDDEPVGDGNRDDIEEVAGDIYYRYLTEEYGCGNADEALASLEMECGTTRAERPCIEYVPELEHDEGGEEQGQFVRRRRAAGAQIVPFSQNVRHGEDVIPAVLKDVEHPDEDEKHSSSRHD